LRQPALAACDVEVARDHNSVGGTRHSISRGPHSVSFCSPHSNDKDA